MPSFVIRVDASTHIGSGHLFRSLALAKELKRLGGDVTWICRELPGKVCSLIHREGFQTYSVPAGPWYEDAGHTIEVLRRHRIKADWIIVDHYGINESWTQKVRPFTDRILQIDDLANRTLDCDVLVDSTADRAFDQYLPFVPKACQLLLGSAYALLRPEFHRLRFHALKRREHSDKEVRKILISLGSIDQEKYTMTALHALAQCRYDGEVHVVLGEGAPHAEEVQKILYQRFDQGIFHHGTKQMANLMTEADLAIGGGGVSSWERCCLGLPTIVVNAADNQKGVIAALERHGAAFYAGKTITTDDKRLASYIQSFLRHKDRRESLGKNAAKLCDGLGTRRVALTLLPVRTRNGKSVTLRPAAPEDCGLMYTWQTHPNTRRYARNRELPTFAEHKQWFQAMLENPSCILNVIEHDGTAAGVLRLDLRAPRPDKTCDAPAVNANRSGVQSFEVSIVIDPAAYRRGIAEAALQAARRLVPEADLYAEVLSENVASRRLFEKVGYIYDNQHYVSKGACSHV